MSKNNLKSVSLNVLTKGKGSVSKDIANLHIKSVFKKPYIVASLIILVMAGTAYYLLGVYQPTQKSTIPKLPSLGNVGVQVSSLQYQGKAAEAEMLLNNEISSTKARSVKGHLYELLSETYLNQNNFNMALAASKNAEEVQPTANSAQLQAESEAGLGNKVIAIQFYRLAEKRFFDIGDGNSAQDMQVAISQLGG
ncbi:MAG TPA: hypothetical protein VNE40_04580 [Candidatus Dormibacteraeota bacterium]|nr:hypothetical protein [Candidatus Dormibacteraeota bacterium]